ncbi:precorrin-3B synthase [Starkeya sp. ORNL1]|uniref:precorrin-3B synthase n=1 Tax=Starkeya sp. ORNL1 TaxID=2709380 RepID=UPI001FEFAD8F|nr:precorrin-3B synthase [Starkeya sp. ORNL1]
MRRGACPTLPAPMATGDGLLARIALAAPMRPSQLTGLAKLSQCCGNGIVELSARGSLQVRGLTSASAPDFAAGVGALGIAVREGLAVETNPLAGLDPMAALDPRPLAQEIAQLALPLAGGLAPKVTVIVDGGGALHLDGLAADIRLTALDADRLALEAGGVALRVVERHEAAGTVFRLLALLAAQGSAARMADLVARSLRPHPEVPPQAASKDVEARQRPSVASILRGSGFARAPQDEVVKETSHQRPPAEPIGIHSLTDGRLALGLGLAFGQTDHAAVAGLAALAERAGASSVATCFGRALLIIGVTEPSADMGRREAAALGFITDPNDPRRSVSACPGRPACASGRIETRALAAELAPLAAGRSLHVSGCAKGCAHPGAADLTIVGVDGGAGLVVEGVPRDAPRLIVLETELAAAAHRILEKHGG